MAEIGYHASHEQFAPSDLLRWVGLAEQAGFTAAMSSDHLFPWVAAHRRGVGFSYAWLGAALQATALPYGVVSAPGQRYHPTVLAQAAITLAEMYPGRFWLALGSGEWVNEHVTGDPWPDKATRRARLRECVDVIRALWRGETVNHDGHVRLRNARVYSTADHPPPLLAAAVSEDTARWAGGWADGLITINAPTEQMRRVVDAFREGGGDGKPVRLQYHLAWAPTDDQAAGHVQEQWRHAGVDYPLAWELELPEYFDAATTAIQADDLTGAVAIGAEPGWHAERLAECLCLGFDQILLHNVGPNQPEFIEVFGTKVLPQLVEAGPRALR
ncbi:TIGR03885 family FMN-dependent LLM class oxidoreductase [Couchioplanes caeruleus]|uniref:LLM class F420-dependent oxidoreductase n=2 Tax=Couchioplanes caeruleus TaxID=56438 RepID=A0A1K0GFX7_9ACTN|nr:TIGR03885 family FMN-dependent LLM class oxidoreductase [Couchioplanes caeruleus]OJF11070.1 LLM class F420-dependent oxidoreductase [Couchioplanes caeruleus subsp. caeruleus]ROP33692.1 putative non-F420 flavinoid oxidoreductase [Couchioplanes caeruleus]